MAGSYQHCVKGDGSFRGIDLIDNLGDAHEALEEMHAMIQQLTGGDKRKIYEAWLDGWAKKKCPPENLADPRLARLFSFEGFWDKGDDEEGDE